MILKVHLILVFFLEAARKELESLSSEIKYLGLFHISEMEKKKNQ